MESANFFDEQTEQSFVKATIVQKYFWAWAKVIMNTVKAHGDGRIAYIDLFAGPGRYKDGAKSTPLLILEKAIEDANMKNMLVTMLNDRDEANCQSLERAINELEGIQTLKYKPQIGNSEVGDEMVQMFESVKLIPTLFFVDPWGYKGLSLKLINSVLKNWGCDCIIFFNYNRINMGLGNSIVEEHMNALFGKERADALRTRLRNMSAENRELTIVEEICEALREMGGKYPLPFRFRRDDGNRTSHHLIFVSKHILGYEIMKDIMAKESSSEDQGVPSFEYSSASREQPLLFSLARPLDELEQLILHHFAGRKLTRDELYTEHHVDTRYIKKNYDEVLRKLEDEGIIKLEYLGKNKRRKHTYGENTTIKFPSLET